MTPSQRAKRFFQHNCGGLPDPDEFVEALEAEIRDAVRSERHECAQLIERRVVRYRDVDATVDRGGRMLANIVRNRLAGKDEADQES